MKIYNEVVIDMNTGETIYEDSFEYYGDDIALCCAPTGIPQMSQEQAEATEGTQAWTDIKDVEAQESGFKDYQDTLFRDWGLESLSMDQFYSEVGGEKVPKQIPEIVNLILQHKPYNPDIHTEGKDKYIEGVRNQVEKVMPKLTTPDAKKQAFLAEEKGMAVGKAEDVYGLGVSAAGRQAQQQAGKLGAQMRGAYGGMGGGMRGAVGGQARMGDVYGEEMKRLGQQKGYAMQEADLAERKGQYGLEKAAEVEWEGAMSTWMTGFKEGGRVPSKETFLDVLTKLPDAGGS